MIVAWKNKLTLRSLILSVALAYTTQTTALDFSSAYHAALSQDANIRAARAANNAGRERVQQARSQWLPNVSFSATRNKNELTSASPNALGITQESQSTYFSQNQTLTFRQALYSQTKSADFKQAESQVADADALLAHELQNVTTRISEAYFGALLAEDQLALLLSQETLTQTQLDAAQKLFTAGVGTRTDIDEVQARLDLNSAQLLEARQNIDYSRQQVIALINQPITKLAQLDIARLQLIPPNPATVGEWQTLAELNSPEIKALIARKEAAQLQIEKSKGGHLPTLDLVAQWSISDSEYVTQLKTNYNTRSIGLQLAVPLYGGGYIDSTIRQATAEYERAVETLEATRRDLGLRLYKEFRGVTEGVLRVKALEQAVRSAEQAVISSQKSAQAGVRTQLDVLKADALKMESMRDLAQARYLYLLSRVRLKALTGLADKASIDEINAYLKN